MKNVLKQTTIPDILSRSTSKQTTIDYLFMLKHDNRYTDVKVKTIREAY
jgi:hypothetical protein